MLGSIDTLRLEILTFKLRPWREPTSTCIHSGWVSTDTAFEQIGRSLGLSREYRLSCYKIIWCTLVTISVFFLPFPVSL